MGVLVASAILAASRWPGVPTPGEPSSRPPGLVLPKASRSATVFAGLSMGTTSRVGSRNVKLIGANPFTGSYGAGPMAGTEQNCEPTTDSSVYPSGAAL